MRFMRLLSSESSSMNVLACGLLFFFLACGALPPQGRIIFFRLPAGGTFSENRGNWNWTNAAWLLLLHYRCGDTVGFIFERIVHISDLQLGLNPGLNEIGARGTGFWGWTTRKPRERRWSEYRRTLPQSSVLRLRCGHPDFLGKHGLLKFRLCHS